MSQDLTSEELKREHKHLLEQLVKADRADYTTKKDIIQKLIETTRALITAGLIKGVKKDNLASYINGRLEENGITYPRNQDFYSLFSDKEKRDYGSNTISMTHRNHECLFEEFDQFTKKCQCGSIQFCGTTYVQKPPPIEETIKNNDDIKVSFSTDIKRVEKKKTDPYSEPVPEYFQRVKYNGMLMAEICDDLTKKYFNDEDIAKNLESIFGKKIDLLVDEQKSVEAQLIFIKKQADYRQKIGPFEKIKGIILEITTWNIAKVAKSLSITPKHMKNNIINHTDQYKKLLQWFKTAFIKCPSCKETIPFEINDWFNQQVVRNDLDLEMRQPVLEKKVSVLK